MTSPKTDMVFGQDNKGHSDYWQKLGIEHNSLWVMDRDDDRKLSYKGSNIPNVQRQLFMKYTRRGDVILDPFFGSGTSAMVAKELNRFVFGVDLHPREHYFYQCKEDGSDWSMVDDWGYSPYGVLDIDTWVEAQNYLLVHQQEFFDFAFFHPPYHDIINYAREEGVPDTKDLSSKNYPDFLFAMEETFRISRIYIKDGGYIGILIGDKYSKGEYYPMGFQVMARAQNKGFKLKATVVKNMSGNETKGGPAGILQASRDMRNGTYTFGHEYIFIMEAD